MTPEFQKFLYALFSAALIAILSACGSTISPTVENTPRSSSVLREATVVLPGHDEPTQITYEVIDDMAVFEGDIILGHADDFESQLGTQSIARDKLAYRWPGGLVPYTIHSSVSSQGKQNIGKAIAHWEANTNINFVLKTASHTDFVEFRKGSVPNACFSAVGRQGGKQTIRLTSSGSCSTSTLIHEIGHAIGLWHEHSREDRDQHVNILLQNVKSGYEGNFKKHVSDGFDFCSYDYASIMHYKTKTFSKNGQPTLETIPPGIPVGNTQLSAGDLCGVNKIYGNTTTFMNLSSSQYQTYFNHHNANGYQPIAVGGYSYFGTKYAAVWQKKAGAYVARHGMTSAQYQNYFNTYVGQGYRLTYVDGYTVNGNIRYAAIWQKKAGPAWVARHGMTSAQYQTYFNTYTSQGFRLAHVSGYNVNGKVRFAAIWDKDPTNSWVARHGMTSSQFQEYHNSYINKGYEIVKLDGYKQGASARLTAIWRKP